MKAMYGTGVDTRTLELMDEIRALRTRVAQLESALEEAAAVEAATPTAPADADVRIDVEEPVPASA